MKAKQPSRGGAPAIDRRTVLASGAAAMATFPRILSLSSLSMTRAFASSEPVVETAYGKVRGVLQDGVYSFRGIRYGASTGGENRFMLNYDLWSGAGPGLAEVGRRVVVGDLQAQQDEASEHEAAHRAPRRPGADADAGVGAELAHAHPQPRRAGEEAAARGVGQPR
jgi:hypothetical protein